jgi:hypothetical protein
LKGLSLEACRFGARTNLALALLAHSSAHQEGAALMESDLPDKKEEAAEFEKVVDEIHELLGGRNFIVSRMKLRQALIAYAAQKNQGLAVAADVARVLLDLHMMSPAELIDLA